MDTKTIVMCVVALLLGMLIANMLKDVCGCKNVVEGSNSTPPVWKTFNKKKIRPTCTDKYTTINSEPTCNANLKDLAGKNFAKKKYSSRKDYELAHSYDECMKCRTKILSADGGADPCSANEASVLCGFPVTNSANYTATAIPAWTCDDFTDLTASINDNQGALIENSVLDNYNKGQPYTCTLYNDNLDEISLGNMDMPTSGSFTDKCCQPYVTCSEDACSQKNKQLKTTLPNPPVVATDEGHDVCCDSPCTDENEWSPTRFPPCTPCDTVAPPKDKHLQSVQCLSQKCPPGQFSASGYSGKTGCKDCKDWSPNGLTPDPPNVCKCDIDTWYYEMDGPGHKKFFEKPKDDTDPDWNSETGSAKHPASDGCYDCAKNPGPYKQCPKAMAAAKKKRDKAIKAAPDPATVCAARLTDIRSQGGDPKQNCVRGPTGIIDNKCWFSPGGVLFGFNKCIPVTT